MSNTLNLSYEELAQLNENLEKRVKELEGSVSKLSNLELISQNDIENNERDYNRNLLFLSNTALKFLGFSSDDDIFLFIGKKLAELTRNAIIIVSSYNEGNQLLSVRFISGINRYLNNILQILNKTPEEIKLQVTPKFMDILHSHEQSMYPVPGGLFQASLGQIPENDCLQIERLLKVNGFSAMGLMKGGNLYGVVLIANKTGHCIKS